MPKAPFFPSPEPDGGPEDVWGDNGEEAGVPENPGMDGTDWETTILRQTVNPRRSGLSTWRRYVSERTHAVMGMSDGPAGTTAPSGRTPADPV